MSFKEKYGPWAVIAGASEGTGRAFAHQIAAQGINCILVARREEALRELAAELQEATGVECVIAAVDLSTDDASEKIIAAAGSRDVGLFINNAGADSTNTHFLDSTVDVWDGQIKRNVMTVMRNCHHFGGFMRDRGRGGILLVGSGSGYGGASFMAVYSGTKAFDMCFGESLWAELKPYGVDVLNLILGRTDTPQFRETLTRQGLPVPPGLASPDDVAKVGLARLTQGPVHNWGQEDDQAGSAPSSPVVRRARIEMIDAATKNVFKRNP